MIETGRLVISPNGWGQIFSRQAIEKNLGNNNATRNEKTRKSQISRTVLLHDSKELDDDLGGRTDEDLALASLLGVVHGVKRIVEDGGLDHFDGLESRFSNRNV